jgi:hypothetical protein
MTRARVGCCADARLTNDAEVTVTHPGQNGDPQDRRHVDADTNCGRLSIGTPSPVGEPVGVRGLGHKGIGRAPEGRKGHEDAIGPVDDDADQSQAIPLVTFPYCGLASVR